MLWAQGCGDVESRSVVSEAAGQLVVVERGGRNRAVHHVGPEHDPAQERLVHLLEVEGNSVKVDILVYLHMVMLERFAVFHSPIHQLRSEPLRLGELAQPHFRQHLSILRLRLPLSQLLLQSPHLFNLNLLPPLLLPLLLLLLRLLLLSE